MRLGSYQIRCPHNLADYRRSFEAGVVAGYWLEPAMICFADRSRLIAYIIGYTKGTEIRDRVNKTADAQTLELHRGIMARHQADAARRLQPVILPRDTEPEWCIACQKIDVYTPAITTSDSEDLCAHCVADHKRFMRGLV
jgi:hypothetical protein